MHLILAFPAWLTVVLVIGLLGAFAAAGVLVVRRFWPTAENEISHNDVAGPIVATMGTVLAVMLSFMVVVEWQEFDTAAAGVQAEASAVIDIYHIGQNMPKNVFVPLQDALHDYVDRVVEDEWPKMRAGERSSAAHNALYRIIAVLAAYEPKTPGQQEIQRQCLMMAQTLADARRQRLFNNSQSIPGLLWFTLIFVGLVTIASCWFFRVRSVNAHVIMTVALAAVLGSIFVLIAEFDLPFRGDVRVTPEAFDHAHEVVLGIEPTR